MTRPSLRRSTAAAILLVCAGTALAGCGSSESPKSSGDPSAAATRAAAKTSDDLLAKVSQAIEAKHTVKFSRESDDQTASGVFKIVGPRMDMDMTMSVPSAGLKDLEMRIVDGTTYFSLPQQTGKGKFFKVDTSKNPSLGQLLDTVKSVRPSTTLSAVAPAVLSFSDKGPETVDGTRTEHFVLVLDSVKATKLSLPNLQIPSSVLAKLPKTYDYNLFVTDDYLMRRVTFDLLGKHNELNYTDWGSDVTVKTPAGSDLIPQPAGF